MSVFELCMPSSTADQCSKDSAGLISAALGRKYAYASIPPATASAISSRASVYRKIFFRRDRGFGSRSCPVSGHVSALDSLTAIGFGGSAATDSGTVLSEPDCVTPEGSGFVTSGSFGMSVMVSAAYVRLNKQCTGFGANHKLFVIRFRAALRHTVSGETKYNRGIEDDRSVHPKE